MLFADYKLPQLSIMSGMRKSNKKSSLKEIAADVALNIFVVLESHMI